MTSTSPANQTRERRTVLRMLDGTARIEGTWLGDFPPILHPALHNFRHTQTTDRAFYFQELERGSNGSFQEMH